MKKILKNKKLLITSLVILAVGIICFVIFKSHMTESIHDDALIYQKGACIVYYPDSEIGKKSAQSICNQDSSKQTYDYVLVPYGDYYLIRYGNGLEYFTDSNYNELVIGEVIDEGKQILSDYLRYSYKKEKKDVKASFLEKTTPEELDYSNINYELKDEYLVCHFAGYDIDVKLPFKYMEKCFGINFGYKDEVYKKPVYIDNEKPYVCLTFEGGPMYMNTYDTSTSRIINALYKYDSTATFFVSGTMLDEDYGEYFYLKKSIAKGNEYGSLTQNYVCLTDIYDAKEIKKEIDGPIEYFKNNIDYTINMYRPPAGLRSEFVDDAAKIPAICWSIDSLDWIDEDVDYFYSNIMENICSGAVISLHDSYEDTATLIEKLLPELINKGYQVVTISDALAIEGLDYNITAWYGY